MYWLLRIYTLFYLAFNGNFTHKNNIINILIILQSLAFLLPLSIRVDLFVNYSNTFLEIVTHNTLLNSQVLANGVSNARNITSIVQLIHSTNEKTLYWTSSNFIFSQHLKISIQNIKFFTETLLSNYGGFSSNHQHNFTHTLLFYFSLNHQVENGLILFFVFLFTLRWKSSW